MINEQSELTQNFQYSYQGQSEAAATTSNSLGELFSDIKDTQLSLMNVLLTVNGIVASVFLALIITQLRNKVWLLSRLVYSRVPHLPLFSTYMFL